MWAGPVAGLLPVGAVVRAVSDSDAKAAEEVRKAFAADQRPIPPDEWDGPGKVDDIGVTASARAAMEVGVQLGKLGLGGAQKLAGKACDAAASTSVGNKTAAAVVTAAASVNDEVNCRRRADLWLRELPYCCPPFGATAEAPPGGGGS